MSDVELRLLADLSESQTIADSSEYAATRNLQHNQLVGVIKSLLAAGLIEGEVNARQQLWTLPIDRMLSTSAVHALSCG